MPQSLYAKLCFGYLFFVLFMAIPACKINKHSIKPIKEIIEKTPIVLINLHQAKGRCKKCPSYRIELLDNQAIKYTGKNNMKVMGEHIIQVKQVHFQELIKQFEQSNFLAFEPYYLTRMKDLPRTAITYQGHKVSFQTKACPEELMALVKRIEAFKPQK